MSDVNPLTGAGMNVSAPVSQPTEAKPQSVFPESVNERLEQEFNSEEAEQFQMLAMRASRTKFATGDRDADIRSYLKFKANINGLLGMLGDE